MSLALEHPSSIAMCQPASAFDPASARLGSGGKRRGRGEEFVGEGRQYCIGHARAAYDAVVILAAPCADGIKRHVGLFPNELESIEAGDALAHCGVIDVRGMIGAASGWLGIVPCVVADNACMTWRLSVPNRMATQAAHGTPLGEQACRLHVVGCSARRANDQHRRTNSASPSRQI